MTNQVGKETGAKGRRRRCLPVLLHLAWAGLLLPLAVGSCIGEGDACDENMVFTDGACVPVVPDGGPDPDGGNNGSDEDDNLPTGMGDNCQSDEDCTGEAGYCSFNPQAGSGYCTLKDCVEEPNDCPGTYSCFDMSIFGPTLPTVCLNEADYQALTGNGDELPAGMGDDCQSEEDCTAEAGYCTYTPRSGTGYCTLSDCVEDPNDCPGTYTCFDMSIFGPTLPKICLNEEDYQALTGG